MRAFVALDLPEPMLGPLTRLQAGLGVGRVVPEENLHLTLAFLGEIETGPAHDVAEGLAAARLGRVTLALAGFAPLDGGRARVLAVGAGGDGLGALQAKVMRISRDAGVDLPRRRFRPHVTVARLPREMGAKEVARLGEFLQLNGTFSCPPEPVASLSLKRSYLTGEGADYETLASVPLTG